MDKSSKNSVDQSGVPAFSYYAMSPIVLTVTCEKCEIEYILGKNAKIIRNDPYNYPEDEKGIIDHITFGNVDDEGRRMLTMISDKWRDRHWKCGECDFINSYYFE